MEPSADQLTGFATQADVAAWSQMPPELSLPFPKPIGASGQEYPSMLGMMEINEVPSETSSLTIEDKPLAQVQKGCIRPAVHGYRLVAGN